MQTIRRILFAVKDPDAARQPGIVKAIEVARSLGASLELFHALTSPVFLSLQPMEGRRLADLRSAALEHARTRLSRFAGAARKRGVPLDWSAEWDYPPHEAVVRRAAASGADLIAAECHHGTRTRPWLIHLTDWELLRHSPLPVLLLRTRTPWRRPVVLAAVDPARHHAKPAALDQAIVAAARGLALQLRGTLHAVHANHPPLSGLALGDPALDAATLARTFEDVRTQAARDFEELMQRCDVPRARRHLLDGNPVREIPRVARRLKAGLMVMGDLSRSGLERLFIGNTAERVLQDLPCDLLVVKPESFQTDVAGGARGMRVLAAPLAPALA
jgi:universal stress protein E